MKTNERIVDASLLLAMKNSYFAHLLTDCFVFARLCFDVYTITQQNLASSSPPCCLARYSQLYQIFWQGRLDRWGHQSALRNSHLKIMLPPAEHDRCSAILFMTCSLLGTIWSVELVDDFSIVSFSMSSVKSEFLFNLLSFLTW
jgi:hypothetical protein